MEFALQRPMFPQDDSRAGQRRPLLEIPEFLLHARTCSYDTSARLLETDPESGEPRKRASTD